MRDISTRSAIKSKSRVVVLGGHLLTTNVLGKARSCRIGYGRVRHGAYTVVRSGLFRFDALWYGEVRSGYKVVGTPIGFDS